ncbi:sulfatase-like hydrolase/transferase [Dasania marina]|uniref:sulfatase-like hydrolase/transferase n=1 Tax=Dasania marina TaxID=471499 RepID=UPI0030DACEFB|tara:strand:- start:50203 stop:52107 length:1905 start_codon:yes stop_codon:yes gene_type:complete
MHETYVGRSIALVWVVSFLFIVSYAVGAVSGLGPMLYMLVAACWQAVVFILPLLLLRYAYMRYRSVSIAYMLHVTALLIILLLISNYKLHAMYNFYIGGFVINLLTTPGGIDALGLSASFYRSACLLFVFLMVFYIVAVRFLPVERLKSILPRKGLLAVMVTAIFAVEASVYAWAAFASGAEYLAVASRVAWHIPVTSRHLLERLGFSRRNDQLGVKADYAGSIDYPGLVAEELGPVKNPMNIVWLTAESLRSDMLDSRVMPNTYAFAAHNSNFISHYSGGNGTRLGMFSQFYGLYGSYWFDILHGRQSPLLLDVLINNNYRLKAFTSARFTYPEFDKTIFTHFKPEQLQEHYSPGFGWQRDKKNTTDLIHYIKQSNAKSKPFFAFMFFESAHANYYFPDKGVIENDYLDDFDYLSVNIAKNITQIKNRYINSSHYLDSRLGLVFDALKEQGLYENTIVIVTGDHGEEFMEKGRWGHNSTFVQEQIRVPMVIHMPGKPAQVVDHMTSHLDVPATLLTALGYEQPASTYSFGQNLFADDYQRDYTVVGDWHGNALITPHAKFILSLKSSLNSTTLSTLNDGPLEGSGLTANDKRLLTDFVAELPRFYQGSKEHEKSADQLSQFNRSVNKIARLIQ